MLSYFELIIDWERERRKHSRKKAAIAQCFKQKVRDSSARLTECWPKTQEKDQSAYMLTVIEIDGYQKLNDSL